MPGIDVRLMQKSDQQLVQAFRCGNSDLDVYLHRAAWSSQQSGGPKTYLAFDVASGQLLGYYSLVTGSWSPDKVPERVTQGMGRYPVPTIHLARFAIAQLFHRQGKGRQLLLHALAKVVHESPAGFRIVDLQAIDADALAFYVKMGFEPLHPQLEPYELFMLTKDIKATLKLHP